MKKLLLFSICYLLGTGCYALNFPMDSVGVTQENGRTYIIHQVNHKETLYAISRNYGVTVDDLLKANPQAKEGINVGDRLKIPMQGTEPQMATHEVKTSETLYSISKQYDATVQQIKDWNDLSDNSLSIGQKLIVSQAGSNEPEPGQALQDSEPLPPTHSVRINPDLSSKGFKSLPPAVPKERRVAASDSLVSIADQKVEEGLAEVIEAYKNTKKYLALHRKAPVGTIIQIKNEMNNLSVFVRVIGKFPDTGDNKKVLIKISQAAYNRLGAIDSRFPVVLTYLL